MSRLTPPSTPPSPASPITLLAGNDISDIFSDSPPSTPNEAAVPSDIPRLRSIHATAGYREGLTSSKARFLQPGFDEGYSFGAAFGLRVGCILGTLEGLWSAYPHECKEKHDMRHLIKDARCELDVGRIFGPEYWNQQGIWTYEIIAQSDEPSIHEVVEQHPLVMLWHERVRNEIDSSGVKVGRFEGNEWEAGRMKDKISR